MHAVRILASAAALALLLTGGGVSFSLRTNLVHAAEDDWKAEYDDICSKTENSAQLSTEEVKGLIERCDKLKPRIEKLDESASKVYLKRLAGCRNFFSFIVESRTNK